MSAAGWVRSPAWDATFLLAPLAVTGLVAAWVPAGATGGVVAWLGLVVAVDVAHVWSTLWRTWLDPAERARHAGWLWALPMVALVATTLTTVLAPARFWTLLAYVAVFHFVRQQLGFAMIYRARAGLAGHDLGGRVERWAIQAVCLTAIVGWHVVGRPFSWFTADDFVQPWPAWTLALAGGATTVLVVAHVALRLGSGRPNPGGDLWFAATALNWLAGIGLARSDLGFTLANVLGHGIPYLALVWHTARPLPDGTGAPGLRGGVGAALALFLAVPLGLALAEELAWDFAVWQEYLPAPALPDWVAPAATAVLAVPQLTHYLLDGVVWRAEPALRRRLGG